MITEQYTLRVSDVDLTGIIRHSALFRLFQEAALKHAENTGLGYSTLAEKKRAWVLNRIELECEREPFFGETLHVHTWHRGLAGYRAFRDYEISLGNRTIVRGSSVWLLINTENRKLVRVPSEINDSYSVVERRAMDSDINDFRPDTGFQPEFSERVGVRPADFDLLGHVNNCTYLDYLDCGLASANSGRRSGARTLKLVYLAEISPGASAVTVDLSRTSDGFRFKIGEHDRPCAAGQLTFQEG